MSMRDRKKLQPTLVELIAGLRHHQVEEAVELLLNYIDAQSDAGTDDAPSTSPTGGAQRTLFDLRIDVPADLPTLLHQAGNVMGYHASVLASLGNYEQSAAESMAFAMALAKAAQEVKQ